MAYSQLSDDERYQISAMRTGGESMSGIARRLGRSCSTVSRELKRNKYPTDGRYRAYHACSMAKGRRKRARSGSRFSSCDWKSVDLLLRCDWSPEQVAGELSITGILEISHETIYQHILWDRRSGGSLWTHLRGSRKKRRKRYGAYDSRGRLAGKRPIEARPRQAELRETIGHWEIDTVHGGGLESVVTLVDRKSGFVQIGWLSQRTMGETNERLLKLMARHPGRYQTITSDNGCEFHGYKQVEAQTSVLFYFANPHHSWERGTNENTNGLIRQYLPKGDSMASLTQKQCDRIAHKLNSRPRKRLGYRTPDQVFHEIF